MNDQEDLIFYKVSLQNYFGIKLLIDKSMFLFSACGLMVQLFKADSPWVFTINFINFLAALSFILVIFVILLKWKGEALNLQQLFPDNFKTEPTKGDYSEALTVLSLGQRLDTLKNIFFIVGIILSFLPIALILNFK